MNSQTYQIYSQFLESVSQHGDHIALSPELDRGSVSGVIKPISLGRVDAFERGISWYSDIESLFHEGVAHGIIQDLIVHGSYGDFTFTPFSDLEITVVLSEGVLVSRKKADLFRRWVSRRLNPFIVQVDPLQHHGVFFLWNQIESAYDQAILPLCAYSNCWSLTGEVRSISCLDNTEALRKIYHNRLLSTLHALTSYDSAFLAQRASLYAVKQMLSNLFLVPPLYYQANGEMLDKRSAIERFLGLSEYPEMIESIKLASHKRANWPSAPRIIKALRRYTVSERIPQGRIDKALVYFCDCSFDEKDFVDKLGPKLKRGCATMLSRLNENV